MLSCITPDSSLGVFCMFLNVSSSKPYKLWTSRNFGTLLYLPTINNCLADVLLANLRVPISRAMLGIMTLALDQNPEIRPHLSTASAYFSPNSPMGVLYSSYVISGIGSFLSMWISTTFEILQYNLCMYAEILHHMVWISLLVLVLV
jgi:hypothetical protein